MNADGEQNTESLVLAKASPEAPLELSLLERVTAFSEGLVEELSTDAAQENGAPELLRSLVLLCNLLATLGEKAGIPHSLQLLLPSLAFGGGSADIAHYARTFLPAGEEASVVLFGEHLDEKRRDQIAASSA